MGLGWATDREAPEEDRRLFVFEEKREAAR